MVVKNLNIDIQFLSEDTETEFGEQIQRLCYEIIIPAIEVRLTPYDLTNQRLVIDHLELDLGTIPMDGWKEYVENKVDELIKEKLPGISDQKQNILTTSYDFIHELELSGIHEALVYFLSNGQLPWWIEINNNDDLEKCAVQNIDENLAKTLVGLGQHDPIALSRLVETFSDIFLEEIVRKVKVNVPFNTWIRVMVKSPLKIENITLAPNHLHTIFWKVLFMKLNNLVGQDTHKLNSYFFFEYVKQIIVEIDHLDQNLLMRREKKKVVEQLMSQLNINKILSSNEQFVVKNELQNYLETRKIQQKQGRENQNRDKTLLQNSIESSGVFERSMVIDGIRNHNEHRELTEDILSRLEDSIDDEIIYNINGRLSNNLDRSDSDGKEIFVSNTGLVLLHPFLSKYFNRLDMLAKGRWKSLKDQIKGVQLMSYLALGYEFIPEYEMTISKCICGLGTSEYVSPYIELTDSEKEQSDTLLKSVIKQWEALKNSSVEALQETFLQRKGKLVKIEKGWKVFVEQDSRDVLLNLLPWNLSLFHLPWLDHLIQVDWT